MTEPKEITFHAGAVSLNGYGILLPGPKYSGKSVMTLGMLLKGCEFLGEDVATVDHASLEVIPYTHPNIYVRQSALTLFPELTNRGWTRMRHDSDGDPFEQAAYTTVHRIGTRVSLRCPVNLVVFPTYDRQATGVTFAPLAPGIAVLQLLESCVDLGADVDQGLDVVIALLNNAHTFTLRYDDVRKACDRVVEVARAIRPTARVPSKQVESMRLEFAGGYR